MIFPTPYAMTTSLYFGAATPSQIEIPLLPEGLKEHRFPPPEEFLMLPDTTYEGEVWPGKKSIVRDEAAKTTRLIWGGEDLSRFPYGNIINREGLEYFIDDNAPWASGMTGFAETEFLLPGNRNVKWDVKLDFKSDREFFYYRYTRRLFENGKNIREKTWDEAIPRDHH
jgi:hypothetical protein